MFYKLKMRFCLFPLRDSRNPLRRALIVLLVAIYLVAGYVKYRDIVEADRVRVQALADVGLLLSALNGQPLKTDDGDYVHVTTTVITTGQLTSN